MATGNDAAVTIGLPHLDTATYANQIFWLLIALVAIYWILSRIALPRIEAVLTERKGTITNDLLAAEEFKTKARAAEAAYAAALAQARTEAARIVAEARAAIEADLHAATEEANARIAERAALSEERIAAIRGSATDSVRAVAADTVGALVLALGDRADPAAAAAAVDARLRG